MTALKLAICVATMRPNHNTNVGPGDIPLFTSQSVTMPRIYTQYNTAEENLGVVRSYQKLYETVTEDNRAIDVLCYIHDDVICREKGWDERVLREFENPRVGVVGFGGAIRHGATDLYKTPYKLNQLARFGYFSNVDDAEVHGERFDGVKDVAVLDGFCLCVRKELLDKSQGWPINAFRFHCYDYFICCMARRFGYKVKVVGIRCHHRGGQTSTTPNYQNWIAAQGTTDEKDHERSHSYIYENFRDVLPFEVP